MTERGRRTAICQACPDHVQRSSVHIGCAHLFDVCQHSGRKRPLVAFLFERLVDPKGVCPHPAGDRWAMSELNEFKAIGSG